MVDLIMSDKIEKIEKDSRVRVEVLLLFGKETMLVTDMFVGKSLTSSSNR